MSLRDDIKEIFHDGGYAISKLEIDKDDDLKGRAATGIYMVVSDGTKSMFGQFSFAKDLGLDSGIIAFLVRQHFDVKYGRLNEEDVMTYG